MKRKSIRFRLTFWYAASLTIAIAVIFASFYLTTQKALYTQIDSSLISHSDRIVDVVTSRATNMHDDIAKDAFLREFSKIPGMLVVILNSGGTIVSSSQPVNPTDDAIADLFITSTQSKKNFFLDKAIGSEMMRFLTNPTYQNNTFQGAVIMGHPINTIQTALGNLLSAIVIIFVIFLLPTVIGGYLNARGAMQPIAAISAKLKQINSGNLRQRVDNPHTGDEIEELAFTFNSLLDRLHSAFQRERQFIGDVAHELKSPLAAQRTNIELALTKERSKEELQQALTESLTDNNRLTSTLKNVLDLAWAEADSATIALTKVDVSHVTRELKDLAVRMGLAKNIGIKGTVESRVNVLGKRDRLCAAFLNIIDNAITYTPQGGTITISLKKQNGQAKVVIADTGIGVAQKDLAHIFERFYRGFQTDKHAGSGLGLAIAKATITAFGGEITVRSSTGKGSEFTILLPLASS